MIEKLRIREDMDEELKKLFKEMEPIPRYTAYLICYEKTRRNLKNKTRVTMTPLYSETEFNRLYSLVLKHNLTTPNNIIRFIVNRQKRNLSIDEIIYLTNK